MGCRQALLSLLGPTRGRNRTFSHPPRWACPGPQKGLPLCLPPHRPRGREAGERQVRARTAGGGGQAGRDRWKTGRATPQFARPGHGSSAHIQPHTRTQSEGPCPYRWLRAKGALQTVRLYPWPGLRGAPPQQRQAAAAGAMGSRVLVQLRRAAASHPGPLLLRGSEGEKGEGGRGEEERRRGRGAAGGREEGKC